MFAVGGKYLEIVANIDVPDQYLNPMYYAPMTVASGRYAIPESGQRFSECARRPATLVSGQFGSLLRILTTSGGSGVVVARIPYQAKVGPKSFQLRTL